jgi:carbon storage regulator CsrA
MDVPRTVDARSVKPPSPWFLGLGCQAGKPDLVGKESCMLVLSRKKEEKIVLCDEDGNVIATVSVQRILRSKVRLGIDAIRDVKVYRQDVYAKIYASEKSLQTS